MQYLILIQMDEARFETQATPMLRQAQLAWGRSLTEDGLLVAADRLRPPPTARTVRRIGGRPMCTDGPFVETKEHLGGYYLLDVGDREAALAHARKMPVGRYCPLFVAPVASARLLPRNGQRPPEQTLMLFYGPPPKVAPVHGDLRSWVRLETSAEPMAVDPAAARPPVPSAVALVDGGLDGARELAEITVPDGGAIELRPVALAH